MAAVPLAVGITWMSSTALNDRVALLWVIVVPFMLNVVRWGVPSLKLVLKR